MTQPRSDTFGAQFVMLDGASPLPKRRQVALVPGDAVPLLMLDLPAKLRGQAREQVARRQLLDRIGLDETSVEMRPFQMDKAKDWSQVLVANAGHMAAWRKRAGRKGKAILPDYLALPAAEGLWTIAASQTAICVRMGVQDGFTAAPEIAATQIEIALDNPQNRPRAVLRLGGPAPAVETLLNRHDIAVVTDLKALRKLDIPAPKTLGHGELALDLRRDPLVSRTRIRRQILPWRWPLLLGTIAAGLWGYAQHLETSRIEQATRAIRIQTQDLVQTHFVTSGPVLDVRTQVSRALADQRQAIAAGQLKSSPLDLLARASAVINTLGGTTQSFSASTQDAVLIVLRVENFAAADQLATALRATGLTVDVIESRVSDTNSGVRVELRLQDGPEGTE